MYAATGKSEVGDGAAGLQPGLGLGVVVERLDGELALAVLLALVGLVLDDVVVDGAALDGDLLAAQVVDGLDLLRVALLDEDRDAGGEVVDEVDALADLLALVVQALLAVLGVRHRGHDDVVAAGAAAR